MLVYDVDSDADVSDELLGKRKQRKAKKEEKGGKTNVRPRRKNGASSLPLTERNVVVPRSGQEGELDSGNKTLDASSNSVTKFRVKKPLNLPDLNDSEEEHGSDENRRDQIKKEVLFKSTGKSN